MKNKKIYFTEDGEAVATENHQELEQLTQNSSNKIIFEENGETSHKSKNKYQKTKVENAECFDKKWFELFEEYNSSEETKEMKDSELTALRNLCKSCFEEESQKQMKKNPDDAKWLETALHKGTSKDRANAGALLVQTNPISNLSALESLIGLAKVSSKGAVDVLEIVTELFKNSLLPQHRKLISLQNRGNDWKGLKNNHQLEKSTKDKIYAYWHFENELKDTFHSYLLNLQANLQNGKEPNKVKGIISASNLLKSCPEKESFLLTMIVNKFGDPDKKIASKATYNLKQLLNVHPNMANVVIMETEKLIFRNNVTEMAQHQAIGFLSMIARVANVEASQRLINISFSFFKIKIEKGDINSKTMQSILNCLRVAIQNINDFNEEKKKIEIATPEVVNTIYRLIYLSNISIAFQALSLLLQLVLVQENENHDRYYNALYKKMSDLEINNVNNRISSLYFHILHRSIQQDPNVPRAKAFLKRLLQMAQEFPAAKTCGALIVISKILKSRPELASFRSKSMETPQRLKKDKSELSSKFDNDDDDGDEVYRDVLLDDKGNEIQTNVAKKNNESKPIFSWMHVKNSAQENGGVEKSKQKEEVTKYDPYKRSAAYCGADLTLYYELIQLSKHFHPTVQLFVEDILKSKNIKYYGDPLKDFSVSHFLDRFSFKNPKKVDKKQESSFKPIYQAKGSRGLSVHNLTEQNCTEEEKFIFDFLQRKRAIKEEKIKKQPEKDDSDVESVNDEEFDAYLDGLGAAGGDLDGNDDDFDYMSELKKDSKGPVAEKKGKKKEKKVESSDDEIDDWESGDDDGESDDELQGSDENAEETDESISLDGDEEEPGMSDDQSDEPESDPEVSTKFKKSKNPSKSFKEKLNDKNLDSLFVAVDDFSDMIEKNSQKSDKHGTLGEIFNQDKSSQKQLDWEEKRRGGDGGGFKRKSFGKKFSAKSKKFKK